MLRRVLLSMSRSGRIRHLVETAPVSRSVVSRFVAGTSAEEAVSAVQVLAGRNLLASLDHLGEDTLVREQADATRESYLRMLKLLADAGLTGTSEVSVKLSAVGQALPATQPRATATTRFPKQSTTMFDAISARPDGWRTNIPLTSSGSTTPGGSSGSTQNRAGA